ncbi:MAG: hypothetical protein CSA54_04335 [Gammaproteobacteria bacterium]|nr:MAG: hypothetical protein CSA54_04335 [Gammaproteobacteria bacterium]
MLDVDAELLPESELEPELERQTLDRPDENGSGENGSREPSKAGFRDSRHASEPKNGSREPQSACFCEHGHTADVSHET